MVFSQYRSYDSVVNLGHAVLGSNVTHNLEIRNEGQQPGLLMASDRSHVSGSRPGEFSITFDDEPPLTATPKQVRHLSCRCCRVHFSNSFLALLLGRVGPQRTGGKR